MSAIKNTTHPKIMFIVFFWSIGLFMNQDKYTVLKKSPNLTGVNPKVTNLHFGKKIRVKAPERKKFIFLHRL
jgi:hypothetical protein